MSTELKITGNVNDLLDKLKQTATSLQDLGQKAGDTGKAISENFEKAANYGKTMNKGLSQTKGLIEDVEEAIKEWEEAKKKATNVKEIEKYNQKIAEGRKHLEEYNKKGVPAIKNVNNQAKQGTEIFKKLAGVMAAVFAVRKILSFGVESMKAFDVQAKAEQKLLIGMKKRADATSRIITLSRQLQKTTLFGTSKV